nr:MAG TPA: hypothetical protein [Caudoviricetes sp.]
MNPKITYVVILSPQHTTHSRKEHHGYADRF